MWYLDKTHCIRHVRRNGIVVWVTREHAARLYKRGDMPPRYPVPAIPYARFDSYVCSIVIWPGVMQIRISDKYLHGNYTGFGAVVTFEHGFPCEVRYDDFN